MTTDCRTFNKQTAQGTVPAGTWVVLWRESDGAWIAHCLKKDYDVSERLQLTIADLAPLTYFPVSHFDSCGWKAEHTSLADYPVIAYNIAGTHYFPFPCANDKSGKLAPPKDKPLSPPWERKTKPV